VRKRYRAEAAQISLAESSAELDRARIDAEPTPPRGPKLSVGNRVWFIDTTARWFELEVVERQGRNITFKSVTGWDADREVEWPYGNLLEFNPQNGLGTRLRHITARRP
jgi:hypothetical protein